MNLNRLFHAVKPGLSYLAAALAGLSYGIGLGVSGIMLGGAGHGTLILVHLAVFTNPVLWGLLGIFALKMHNSVWGKGGIVAILFTQYLFVIVQLARGIYTVGEITQVAKSIPIITLFVTIYLGLGQIYLWGKVLSRSRVASHRVSVR